METGKRSPLQLLKDILIGALIVFGGIYMLIAIGSMSSRSTPPPQVAEVSAVAIGSEGRLRNGSPLIPVAVDEETLPDLKRIAGNADLSGIGPLFFVTEDTPVRVSESGIGGVRVRILAGSQSGRVGWVPFEWVKAPNNQN